jgi:hypothetical protein
MAKFAVGDQVLVPASRLANPDTQPYALMPRVVLGRDDRSIRVDDGAGGTVHVASRLAHPASLGFLVLRVGDFASEHTLLDPLARSIVDFLRLLVPDSDLRAVSLRTVSELEEHWRVHHGGTSHVIIIGHGSESSLAFVGDGPVAGGVLAGRLQGVAPDASAKTFVSMACLTGRAAFARPFSSSPICRDLIAPFQSVHGAAASQFCQRLLGEHLLDGREMPYAYARAAKGLAGSKRFRRWRAGKQRSIT